MCSILDQGKFGYEWEEIVMSMCSMKCNKNIASVVRRLVLAACVYHIWSERNKRLFYDKQRDWLEVVNAIAVKISSLQAIIKLRYLVPWSSN